MSVGDLATATPTTSRTQRATSRHQGNSAIQHQGSRFRIPSHRTQKRGASRPSRGDWRRPGRPHPRGAQCDGGATASAGLGQPPPATSPQPDLSAARGSRDCPRAVSLRAPASVGPSLPGTLRVGAPRKDRTHERAHARPPRRGRGELKGAAVRRSSRLQHRCRPHSRSAAAGGSFRGAGGRTGRPGALRRLSLLVVPASSLSSSSGRGAVGACAEPPPPRPRPAPPRAAAARCRRRRCACCSSPSPLQCEGLEDGRLAELRG